MIEFRQLLSSEKLGTSARSMRWLLRLVSLPYGVAVRARNAAYELGWLRSAQATVPIISVGNLSVGGTGKSPTVAWLAGWLRQHDLRVAVLSRGYGQLESGQNDEALELELQFPDVPHLQHWDRIASARLATEELEMEVLLLDDGFQHRRLARNLDIVLLDATDSAAARWLLPGGLMREPLSSLSRADVVILTRTAQADPDSLAKLDQRVRRRAPQAIVLQANHRPACLWSEDNSQGELSQLSGAPVLAVCAIGHPDSFYRSLESLGAQVLDTRTFADHHAFTAVDIAALIEWTQQYPNAKCVICTMKDWVKIRAEKLGQLDLRALKIELQFTAPPTELEARLAGLCLGND